jgi:hypothetical protein
MSKEEVQKKIAGIIKEYLSPHKGTIGIAVAMFYEEEGRVKRRVLGTTVIGEVGHRSKEVLLHTEFLLNNI